MLKRITGRLPILSLNVPQSGAKIKFINEYTPAINPICKSVAPRSFEKVGSIGIISPNPNRSINIVMNKTNNGDFFMKANIYVSLNGDENLRIKFMDSSTLLLIINFAL